MIKDVTDLKVYQRSMELIPPVKKPAGLLPKNEYSLRNQCTKTAYQIPATIAEGYGKKNSDKEFKRFLQMALGSSDEMITHLRVVRTCKFKHVKSETCAVLIREYKIIAKQLTNLIKKWKKVE
jgi:four helix bundle protein